ncbi:MAG: hypothetical protein WDO70_02115 [Alphaproteobacteria bacterium]
MSFAISRRATRVDHFFASRRAAKAAGEALAEDWGLMSGKLCLAQFKPELEHLRDTILAEKPRALLAVGRTPLWALTGLNGVTAEAGKTHPCRFAPTIPVICTYHPSFILRGNWALMPQWVGHMRKVKGEGKSRLKGRGLCAATSACPPFA